MAELTMGGKTYQVVGAAGAYASSVVAKKRCAIRIGFGDFYSTHFAAVQALQAAGRDIRDCSYEVHLRVTCEKCQKSLTADGLGMLFMAQIPNLKVAGGQGLGAMQQGKCISCQHPHCYLLYDPEGFPKTAPAVNAVEKAKPFLVLILPPGVDGQEIVQAAAKEIGFRGGAVRVMHGPQEISEGMAAALLARMDSKEGTSYSSRPFRRGSGAASGHPFAYVVVD